MEKKPQTTTVQPHRKSLLITLHHCNTP